jgi:hypothetical protein
MITKGDNVCVNFVSILAGDHINLANAGKESGNPELRSISSYITFNTLRFI